MAKRFIDTELWDKESFNSCTEKQKLLALFITCKCDAIGVFKMAPMLINAYVGSIVTEEEILSYCKKNLADFKVPKYVEFREDLPKNPTGKIMKNVLREEEEKKSQITQTL